MPSFTRLLPLWKRQYSHLFVCLDDTEKTFRHLIYPPYKQNRAETPDEIKLEMDYFFEGLHALQIPMVRVPGFEADDIISTLSAMTNIPTVVLSNDRDLAQVVSCRVQVITGKGEITPESISQMWGGNS